MADQDETLSELLGSVTKEWDIDLVVSSDISMEQFERDPPIEIPEWPENDTTDADNTRIIAEAINSVLEDPLQGPEFPLKVNAEYRIYYATNRKPSIDHQGNISDFGGPQGTENPEKLYYGLCDVFIPKTHKFGSVGTPWWRRNPLKGDDHLQLKSIDPYKEAEFWSLMRDQLSSLDHGDSNHIVVFVHGYNVSFAEAALRTAQIGFDLRIKGPMAFFSWPSEGRVGAYTDDEATIESSAKLMEEFFIRLLSQTQASAVHLIVHSMGNRAILNVVHEISIRTEARTGKHFKQIILAAADVDPRTFKQKCAAYPLVADRTTMYVSRADKALGLSNWIHGRERVGFTPPVFITDGIDTVNVTNIDLSIFGHGYVAEARQVLEDMHSLLHYAKAPSDRNLIRRAMADGAPYWEMK